MICKIETISNSEKTKFIFPTDALNRIEENWTRLLRTRTNLYNATLLRVIFPIKTEVNITTIVTVPDISYREVVGLRYHTGDYPNSVPDESVFQVLSCYLFVRTLDKKIVFLKRDSGDWNIKIDLPGGFLQHQCSYTDMSQFAKERTLSDLNISGEHIKNVSFVGTYDAKYILEFMGVYIVDLNIDLKSLREISGKEIFEKPDGYRVELHDEFFDIKLHDPAARVMNVYLSQVLSLE